MRTFDTSRPFPIPVVAFGPGSQPEEDEALDYVVMPRGMATYRAPRLPEPEDVQGRDGALRLLQRVLAAAYEAAAGGRPAPVPLAGLAAPELALVNQVLGEGEVSARVLAEPGRGGAWQIQESVFAGIWRVLRLGPGGEVVHDAVEAAPVPQVLLAAAAEDAAAPHAAGPLPAEVFNVPPLLTELADRRAAWVAGEPAHVVNLTLLPLTPADIAHLDHQLGTGRVLLLSRGYGNCRITNARVPRSWRVVYYNSQDQVILNTVEVTGLPDAARAAPEDLADSAERLADVLAWVGEA